MREHVARIDLDHAGERGTRRVDLTGGELLRAGLDQGRHRLRTQDRDVLLGGLVIGAPGDHQCSTEQHGDGTQGEGTVESTHGAEYATTRVIEPIHYRLAMPRVGLHMIVRDEAHVIERCLRSVRPLIDWWVVSDTGSSDGTQELVRRTLADVPGRLLERPWVNFGHNRQEALEAARALPQSSAEDHVLWIDADEELVDLPTGWPDLDADGHHLEVEFGPLRYQRLALVRLGMPWRWRGAVHEYLDLPDAEIGALGAPRVLVRKEGARSKDPDTYRKDALLIEAELVREPDDPRMQFYLGQSWRDAESPNGPWLPIGSGPPTRPVGCRSVALRPSRSGCCWSSDRRPHPR